MSFSLVYSAGFTSQLKSLEKRYAKLSPVLSTIEFSLRNNPSAHGLDGENYGVAFTKPFGDVPALRVAFRVATKTVTLLAIEPRAEAP